MKARIYLSLLVVSLVLSSCATIIRFPISSIEPAADGTVKFTKDKNNNYILNVKVKYMANADRLTPPKKLYVVWIKTDTGEVKNIGQLMSDNKNNALLTGTTSSRPVQIFITAEDAGDVNWPSNQEIFRIQDILLK
jgi:hypothetical protein